MRGKFKKRSISKLSDLKAGLAFYKTLIDEKGQVWDDLRQAIKAKHPIAMASAKPLGQQLPNWLTVRNQVGDTTDIIVSGPIGKSWWDDTGTNAKEFRDALNAVPQGRKINLRVNSEGGSIKEGLEMYNAIKARAADVTAYIDGYAISIASVFPLAASKVVSPKSCIWMIHEPLCGTQGNAEEHRKSAEMLDKHGDTLAAIYASELGKTQEEMRAAMKAETWFTGEEATAFGLGDETPDDGTTAAYATLDLSKFHNVPQNIKTLLAVTAKGEHTNSPEPSPITAPTATLSAPQTPSGVKTGPTTTAASVPDNTQPTKHMPEPIAPVAAATPPDVTAELVQIKAQLASERATRITNEVKAIAEGRIPAAQLDAWTARCIKDETLVKDLAAMPVNHPGGEPLGVVTITAENPLDRIRQEHKTPSARVQAMKSDWKEIYADACKRDARRGSLPVNSNTYSATLVTSFLMDGAVTDLQNVWAMLGAFSMDFTTDPYKPLATGVLAHVTGGATTQTDATNFESGDSVVAPVSVVMHQYTQSFNVSNADLQNGLRMEKLTKINTAKFADKIIQVAAVPITSTLFTGTPLISAPEAFGFSDLATLQGQLKKSTIKNIILDGEYIARVSNTPGFFQNSGVLGGTSSAWKSFGWDLVATNTNWTTAGANVRGFACNPQAIGGITGLPVTPPNVPGGILNQTTMTVPGLEVPVAVFTWFNPSTRTMWCSYDIMAGFKEVDTTAGFVVGSGATT